MCASGIRWKEHFQEVLNRKDPDELAKPLKV
jgi:hypothetical protein